MNLQEKIKKYGLQDKGNAKDSDIFTNNHYTIITRKGIDKIQAIENISITYDVVRSEKDFASVKATASKDDKTIQTFGSALYGLKKPVEKNGQTKWMDTGTCQTFYVLEMAEKRAMSRAVLKLTGFYELGVFGEDESEDFKRSNDTPKPNPLLAEIEALTDFSKPVILYIINKSNKGTQEERESFVDKVTHASISKWVKAFMKVYVHGEYTPAQIIERVNKAIGQVK